MKKGKDNKIKKNKNIEKREKGNVSMEIGAKIDINELHEKLGHPEEEVTKLMGNYMKLKIKGKMENCENCGIRKMRQKNVKKGPKEKSTKPGYRIYIDITLSKYISAGGSKFWFLSVDEATHMKFSMFLKQKSEVKERFIPFLKELRHNMEYRLNTLDVTTQVKIVHSKMRVLKGTWELVSNIQHWEHRNKME